MAASAYSLVAFYFEIVVGSKKRFDLTNRSEPSQVGHCTFQPSRWPFSVFPRE
jgi:hypothetical protein